MKTTLKFFILLLILTVTSSATQKIYLLHGYGSAPIFMITIENYLKSKKMDVVNYGYPSITKDLEICAESLGTDIKRHKTDSISFVTHSMGALLVRSLLGKVEKDSCFPKINRIVMITPPNHGAELADLFANNKVLQFILGPNLKHLVTDTSSLANHLPVPTKYEIGIIIGVSKNKNGYNAFIKGNNDGYLTPESAKLGTEKEDIYVPSGHAMIIHNRKVLELVYSFLTLGNF
jgi:uncharacterized alpha/beta hydrolase family protein